MPAAELYALPDPSLEKTCSKCKQVKPLSEFCKLKRDQNKLRGFCKVCSAQKRREWVKRNPQKAKESDRRYYKKHGRNKVLCSNFGITPEEYNAILVAQKNRCAVCGNEPQTMVLAVDHCHTSGKIRGLLCRPCNLGIGNFKDNPRLLQAAITYLELRN